MRVQKCRINIKKSTLISFFAIFFIFAIPSISSFAIDSVLDPAKDITAYRALITGQILYPPQNSTTLEYWETEKPETIYRASYSLKSISMMGMADVYYSLSNLKPGTNYSYKLTGTTNILTFITLASISKYKLSGYIKTDFTSNSPMVLKDFKVELLGSQYCAYTDSTGYYEFNDIPEETDYTWSISKSGFITFQNKINLKKDLNLNMVMWAGDYNGDDVINMKDIMELALFFNTIDGDGKYDAIYDINKDNAINMADIIILASHFNSTINDYQHFQT